MKVQQIDDSSKESKLWIMKIKKTGKLSEMNFNFKTQKYHFAFSVSWHLHNNTNHPASLIISKSIILMIPGIISFMIKQMVAFMEGDLLKLQNNCI